MLRVLIVDDDPTITHSFDTLLRILGYAVKTANDGTQAERVAAEFRPDVAVIDIGMPEVSGHDLARWIRQQPWGEKMLLIAVSGWDQDEERQRSMASGFDHHLAKPVDLNTLRGLLDAPRAHG